MKKLILTILILFCATMAYSIPDNLPEKIEKMLPWTRLELPTETGNSGEITKHYAEVGSSDLLFHIYETDINSLSPADELAKWKKLLDDGAITQEEYNAKKKQLLGL